jgi:hypothetical protein
MLSLNGGEIQINFKNEIIQGLRQLVTRVQQNGGFPEPEIIEEEVEAEEEEFEAAVIEDVPAIPDSSQGAVLAETPDVSPRKKWYQRFVPGFLKRKKLIPEEENQSPLIDPAIPDSSQG